MAQIDRFIDALHRLGADHLEISTGSQVTLGVDGDRHAVTAQAVTGSQVDRLLGEILPASSNPSPGGAQRQQFLYTAPSGLVSVSVAESNGGPGLLITPSDVSGDLQEEVPTGWTEQAGMIPASEGPTVAVRDDAGRAKMEELFRMMVEKGCSDLHVSTGMPPVLRQDGDILVLEDEAPLTPEESRRILYSITPPHKQEEFEQRHDSDFAYEIPDVARFRCNLFMDRKGMGGVFRFIPTSVMTVEDLGLRQDIIDLCKLSRGLVLVTGPTGSGKSTTLAALVDYINRTRSDHVVTIEDPIEFVHPNNKCLINQREVGVHTQSFKVALRAALREDPDVVLVGEMRDLETVAIAIETAETGHLVFGTLHTRTAPSTVDRIIDQFPAEQQSQIRTMLAESLKGVISQTLVRAKAGGRVAAMEFLLVNVAVANLIREGKTYQITSVMQTNKGKGMQTLNDALFDLVQGGRVEPEFAYAAATDRAELRDRLAQIGIVVSL
jgi:twitching motility protein PilT